MLYSIPPLPKGGRVFGLSVLLGAVFAATLATGETRHVSWTPDKKLEDQMDALKLAGHYCLPPPYPLNFDSYIGKLASSLYDNCVTENVTADQIKKYATYAAVSMTPAATYSVPYALSELKSDAMKCVLKSFVGVSSLNDAQKAAYGADIDDIFTIDDWTNFVQSAAGLTKTSGDALAAALTQTSLSAVDRTQDTGLFSRAYATVAEARSMRFLKELWWDEWVVALDEYDYNIEQCRYDDAQLAVSRAAEMADADCKALGHQYRTLEAGLVSDIIRTYNTIDADPAGTSNNTVSLASGLTRQKIDLKRVGTTLASYVSIFSEISEVQDNDLVENIKDFEMTRLSYEALYKKALDRLDTPDACNSITNLERDITRSLASLNQDSHSCREALFGGRDGLPRLSPNTLRAELLHVARSRSYDWWVTMDQIWASMNACDMETAQSLRRQLLTEIANNPIYRVIDGVCDKQEQSPLVAELDAVTTPAHCLTNSMPKDLAMPALEGKSVVEASKVLAQFGQHFVMGDVKPASDRPDGKTAGHVAYSDPPAEQMVPAGTKVTLFVYPASQDEDPNLRMISYAIVGLSVDQATKLLQGETQFFAVPPAVDGPPAQGRQVPGTVQTSNPAPGTYAPRNSAVQLYTFSKPVQPTSGQVCLKINPDPSKVFHRYDTNGTSDGRIRLDCRYFDDGRLKSQTPFLNGKWHGEVLKYYIQPACDWFAYSVSIYAHDEAQQRWTNKCTSITGEPNTGKVYTVVESLFEDGRLVRSTEFYTNGNKRYSVTYDSEGRTRTSNVWYQNGKHAQCVQYDADGKKSPCSE